KTHKTKTAKTRRVPMSKRLRAALDAHVKQYGHATYDGVRSPWVFHYTETRGRHHVAGARLTSVRSSFKRAAKRAGISREFCQHDLRHRRATAWLAQGKGLALVQQALGHSSAKMTERYTHLLPEHLKVLVD